MPELEFFAAGPDIETLLGFVLGEAGCQLFEGESIAGQSLRRFTSATEVLAALESARGHALAVMLYAPSMGGRHHVRRLDLTDDAHAGAPWREIIEGWGLIQLMLRGVHRGKLGPCQTSHNSESRARKWEALHPQLAPVAEWDFAEVTRISTLINRHVRSLAVGQDGSRSVLAGARALVAEGSIVFAPF